MTHEEAINELNGSKIYVPSTVIDPLGSLWNDAIELAVEALEKQIPKKPIHGQNCGSCDTFNFRHRKFCCECGQRIEWGRRE